MRPLTPGERGLRCQSCVATITRGINAIHPPLAFDLPLCHLIRLFVATAALVGFGHIDIHLRARFIKP